uniref:Uncharacterized protein n=2 Tax=Cannabis sativa TaxID=3483 RepID=A0A803QSF9_CANSA
ESVLIYECCFRVLSTSEETKLICATLSTLLTVLKYIPSADFFKFSLLDLMMDNFPRKPCSNLVLQCLIEIVGLDFPKVNIVQLMHNLFLHELQIVLPLNMDIPLSYDIGSSETQAFIQNLAMFLISFYQCHLGVLEITAEAKTALITGLDYLIKISYVNDTEVKKQGCLLFWKYFVLELLEAHLNLDDSTEASNITAFEVNPLDMIDENVSQIKPRKELFAEIMSKLRMLLISCMVKPEDVLIVEDKNQMIDCEAMMDNDALLQDK